MQHGPIQHEDALALQLGYAGEAPAHSARIDEIGMSVGHEIHIVAGADEPAISRSGREVTTIPPLFKQLAPGAVEDGESVTLDGLAVGVHEHAVNHGRVKRTTRASEKICAQLGW